MKTSVVVWIFFILSFSQIHGELTRTPSDTVASWNSTVTLECFTENKHYPPTWTHKPEGSTDFEDVYLVLPGTSGEIIGRPTEKYYERFKVVENRETGDYSLQIRSVKIKDAGVYACTARGGLGQQATATLTVTDYAKSLECKANTTQVLDHRFCHHKPDYISVSCRFELLGQTLPIVTWVRTDQPEIHRKTEFAHWTVEAGIAESTYLIRDNEKGLNGASFACIVSDVNCTTPTFKVLEIHHVSKKRIVRSPAEVDCNVSLPHQTKCKWVRQKAEKNEPEVVVSESRLLNLYRPDMTSGKYVCIVECNLGGNTCLVEALIVSYEPINSDSEAGSRPIALIGGIVAGVVGFVACASILLIVLYKIVKKSQSAKPMIGIDKPSEAVTKENGTNGAEAKILLLTSSSESNGTNGKIAISICDSDAIPRANDSSGSRNERLRRIEESARQRMNAIAEAEAAAKKEEILANRKNIDESGELRHRIVEKKEENETEGGMEE